MKKVFKTAMNHRSNNQRRVKKKEVYKSKKARRKIINWLEIKENKTRKKNRIKNSIKYIPYNKTIKFHK